MNITKMVIAVLQCFVIIMVIIFIKPFSFSLVDGLKNKIAFYPDIEAHNNGNIFIHYDKDSIENVNINKINRVIELANEENDKYLPSTTSKVDIYLLKEKNFNKKLAEWSDAEGLFFEHENKIYIKVKDSNDPLYYYNDLNEYIENMVAHEFTHFRLNESLRKYKVDKSLLPIWFNEGYSEFIANKVSIKRSPMDEEFNEDLFTPFQSLNTNEDWGRELGDYEQVQSAVNEIINKGGLNTLDTLLVQLNANKGFYNIIKEEFDIDVTSQAFEQKVQSQMRKFYTGES